jgi:hypothetical protein
MRNCAPEFDASASPRNDAGKILYKKFFIIFVDATFTTLLERLFTKVFEVIRAIQANDCVCRPRHAD